MSLAFRNMPNNLVHLIPNAYHKNQANRKAQNSQHDSVSFTSGHIQKDCPPELEDALTRLFTKFTSDNNHPQLGEGNFSRVFECNINNTPSVAKVSKHKPIIKNTSSFQNEVNIMKKLEQTKNDFSPHFIGYLRNDEKDCIFMSKVPGNSINPDSAPLNKDIFKDLMKSFYKLDSLGIFHRDLKPENILISNNKVGIIDYGATLEFDHFNYNQNKKLRFPAINSPSNNSNFEYQTLMPYLQELSQKSDGKNGVLKLFKDYIQSSSGYHYHRAEMLESSAVKNNIAQNPVIKDIILFEKLQGKLFKNPSQEVLSLELSRIKMLQADHQARNKERVIKNNDFIGTLKQRMVALKLGRQYLAKAQKTIKQEKQTNGDKDYLQYLEMQKKWAEFYYKDHLMNCLKELFNRNGDG